MEESLDLSDGTRMEQNSLHSFLVSSQSIDETSGR